MKHPDWYFKYFNEIFSRKEGYDYEIQLIKQICSLYLKSILEVGAGTGEHARRLLNENPKYIELVDIDPNAIDILKDKFADMDFVKIRLANGFEGGSWGHYDLVIVMYSIILLDIQDIEGLSLRLDILLRRLSGGGTLIFEIVDKDVSATVYKEGDSSVLYEDGENNVTIRSSYSKNTLDFVYSGQLDAMRVHYKASLLAIGKSELFSTLETKSITDYGCVSIDDLGRRLLVYARK